MPAKANGKGKSPDKVDTNTAMQKSSPIPKGPKGHRGHVKGTRKEQVAIEYDKSGKEAAIALAEKLGLKTATAKNWIDIWIRADRAQPGTKKIGRK